MNTVTFKYKIGETVKVGPDLTGKVTARADFGSHQQFLVAYWADNNRLEEWLSEFEILPTPQDNQLPLKIERRS